jgi:DNA-binding NtrC family response regulator
MGPRLKGRNIALAVADEPLRQALCRTLEREGATAVTHSTARALIESVSASPPDACIIDVDLPDLSGEELVDQIKQVRPRMAILLVSAHLFPVEGLGLRGLPTLPLPFRRKELMELLNKVLSTAGVAP